MLHRDLTNGETELVEALNEIDEGLDEYELEFLDRMNRIVDFIEKASRNQIGFLKTTYDKHCL